MANIQIIVGSVMGTAEQVAVTLAEFLRSKNHQVTINTAFQAGQLAAPDEVLLICTSNTGMGDLPANIGPLHQHLTCDFPNIAGRRYGIVNLGDSSYPNFAQAGKTLDDALADIGATRIGEPLILDAIYVDDYHEEAKTWGENWQAQL